MSLDAKDVTDLKNNVKIDLKIIEDYFEDVYKDLSDLEEALGPSPELNAHGRFQHDGFFQAVQNLQGAHQNLTNLFDKICKMI